MKTPKTLKTTLKESNITKQICKEFTIDFNPEYEFKEHTLKNVNLPIDYNIGYITGNSGSGKSLLLKEFGQESIFDFSDDEAVCSHFEDYKDATDKLQAVGFNTVPQWLLPYRILSTGQKYRVNLARSIKSNMVMDEFTSYIDRNTALGLCNSFQRYVRINNLKNIVLAGVHKDIIEYLKPDWVYDTCGELTINSNIYELDNMDTGTFKKKEIYSKTDIFMTVNTK